MISECDMFQNFLFLVGSGKAGDLREFTRFEISIRWLEESNTFVSSFYQSVKHDDVLHDNPHLSDSVFWKITKCVNNAAVIKYHTKLAMILCKRRKEHGAFTSAIKALCIMDEECK